MKLSYSKLTIAAMCLSLNSMLVHASDWSDRVSIAGFSTAMYNVTDEKVPFNGPPGKGHDDQGGFSGTKMGLNISARINEKFSFASQFFAAKEENDYSVTLDWAFGALQLNDSLTLRTGKMKYPVGIVNEYVDVGYALPWISAPSSFYSSAGPAQNGPGVTRVAYTGVSLLWEIDVDDWEVEIDLFGGEVRLANSDVRGLSGLSVEANLDDELLIKLTTNQGTMQNVSIDGAVNGGTPWEQTKYNMGLAMEGEKHEVISFGVKYDANDILFMYEWADVSMTNLPPMDTTSWYTTVGYQMGKFLPVLTFENIVQGTGAGAFDDDQDIVTLGLRWDYISNVAIKFEVSQIKLNQGNGFFGYDENPSGNTTNMFGTSIDLVF